MSFQTFRKAFVFRLRNYRDSEKKMSEKKWAVKKWAKNTFFYSEIWVSKLFGKYSFSDFGIIAIPKKKWAKKMSSKKKMSGKKMSEKYFFIPRYEFLNFSESICFQTSESSRSRKKTFDLNIIWHNILHILCFSKRYAGLISTGSRKQ